MPRKLKTYITSEGFFEKSVTTPSMKAALEAWGGTHNLFSQGFAKETDDPAIISATMAHPGIVLKRPVGSDGPFRLHAELSRSVLSGIDSAEPIEHRRVSKSKKRMNKNERTTVEDVHNAAKAFEREEKRREKQRQKEKTLRELIRKKREVAVARAKSALSEADKRYDKLMAGLKTRQLSINEKIESEEAKWYLERKRLEVIVKQARER